MRTYIVTQVLDWNSKPLKHLVQMRVEARSPKQAIAKISREYKFPEKMFTAEIERTNG